MYRQGENRSEAATQSPPRPVRAGLAQRTSGLAGARAESRTASSLAPSLVSDVLRAPGQPLDTATRAVLEPRFAHDFSRVRVHADAPAAESARALNARAYTVGSHVVFGAGQYAPQSAGGARLLAHELTHVVQQRGEDAPAADTLAVGPTEDAYEREADTAAASVLSGGPAGPVTPVAAPRLQGSILGAIGSFFGTVFDALTFPFRAIYRLFGGEFYYRETLEKYLTGLRQRGRIESNFDSDNKARACIARENELGPYDANTKILLIRELLDGWTSGLDESATIDLLRRAQPAERQQIVTAIGRNRLWDNFSGDNRRVIEAITLTAADAAGDALVTRLRAMSEGEVRIYETNALDPDVRRAAQRAVLLQRITAPVPVGAALSPQGVASFQINGVDVVVQPDTRSNDEQYRTRAFTEVALDMDRAAEYRYDEATDLIHDFTPPHILVRMQTIFGPGVQPGDPSGYGRGTTEADKAAKATTVRFHESRHAEDWFEFLRRNPAPVFGGAAGMTRADFQRAQDRFNTELRQYHARAVEHSVRMTDCPGAAVTPEQLAPFGLNAAICHQH